jgi:hypothetical protein
MSVITRTWKSPSITKLINETKVGDPVSAIREKARILVSEGIDKGWEGPPFNPAELAQMLGISG